MDPKLCEPSYAPTKAEEALSTYDEEDSGVDTGLISLSRSAKPLQPISKLTHIAYGIALIASLVVNIALGIALHNSKASQQTTASITQQPPQPACQPCPTLIPDLPPLQLEKTPYAELEYNTNGTWEYETPYAQENITAADEEWMAVDISTAFVALTKDHAHDMGLPRSLRFPWDENKELYLISSIHSVHCLTVLHRSNLEYRTGHTQTYSTEHVLHCLDNLRVDIQCSADDTPRFIPPTATESTVKTGVGQIRQCRSWDRLNDWAREHDACFKYNQFLYQELKGQKVYPLAWQFCEKGSEYLSTVQKFLRKDSNWVAPPPEFPDIDKVQGH